MLVPKEDFIGLNGIAHLACGGQPPLLRDQREAFEAFAADKSTGMEGYENHWQVCAEVKQQLAAMTGLEAEDFGLIGNASEGIARAVSSLDWSAGDTAVVSALDYASGRYALAALERLGVTTRLVEPRRWTISEEDLLAACDDRTRLVYVSQVNAHTGQHVDLSILSEVLGQRKIAFVVDASHALGVIPVPGHLCDFLVSSTYKFLLSTHSGVFAWNRWRWPHFIPSAVGWNSADPGESPNGYHLAPDARRAELGNSNHLDMYLLRAALTYLAAIDDGALQTHVDELTLRLSSGLKESGYQVITPEARENRGPNVSFLAEDPREFVNGAAVHGIKLWGDAGRVRASVHAFVTPDDVERFLAFAKDRSEHPG